MMTKEQKQALIARCDENINRAKNTESYTESHGLDFMLMCIAYDALTQPAIPALKLPVGWRLMPDEPTEEMMRAMYQAQDMWPSAHCDNMRETQMSFARPRYIAALATAPKAPSVPHTAPIEPICATGGAEWVKLTPEQAKKIYRDLDACQKVIHYARGFDPSYVTDAQDSLKIIDYALAAAPEEK